METEIYICIFAIGCIIFCLIALLIMLLKKRIKSIVLVLLCGFAGCIIAYYFQVIKHLDFLAASSPDEAERNPGTSNPATRST